MLSNSIMGRDIDEFSDYPSLVQSSPEQNKRKRKTWEGTMPTRKSARLNKESAPWIVENKLPDEESYHGDSEDNVSSDGETLEHVSKIFKNDLSLTMYRPNIFNNWNLTKEKLRLVQQFMKDFKMFYKFAKDTSTTYSFHYLWKFKTTNNLTSIIRASFIKLALTIIEYHEKFYVPCFKQQNYTLKDIESNICRSTSSLMLVEYFRNHESII